MKKNIIIKLYLMCALCAYSLCAPAQSIPDTQELYLQAQKNYDTKNYARAFDNIKQACENEKANGKNTEFLMQLNGLAADIAIKMGSLEQAYNYQNQASYHQNKYLKEVSEAQIT
jgi:hypothetical protein